MCYNVGVKKKRSKSSVRYKRSDTMNYKNFIAGAMAFALAACASGCGDKKNSDSNPDTSKETTAPAETTAEPTTEEATEPEPPTPVEASDPNAVTFDDGIFDFAFAKNDDDDCAKGELSVVELMGNKMLKFTDDNTVPLDGKVQKIGISATKLLGSEGAAKVRSIEFDMYAQATADNLKTDDADGVRAPGWIGGGGGTVTAQEKWYDFKEFSGGEYNFETSGNVHAVFKFLLADSGQCWSEDMEDANFLIMRWGIANESDMYIDNIVFYDEDGNSIPLAVSEAAEGDIKSKVEKKIEEMKSDAEQAKDDIKAEYEKVVEDVKNSENYEEALAKLDEIEGKLKEAKSDIDEAEQKVLDEIDKAKAQAEDMNKQAQEAIEDASKQIEKAKNQ